VSSNIEPEEAQAIAEMTQTEESSSAVSVTARDFREPIRLSSARLKELHSEIGLSLSAAAQALARPLREVRKLELGGLTEVDGRQYFDQLQNPFLCVLLDCDGRTGWLSWDIAAAVRAADVALTGGMAEEPEERALSPIECGVIQNLLTALLTPLGENLGMSIRPTSSWQDVNTMRVPDDEDMQRLLVHMTIDGPGDPSELSVYLPGLGIDPAAQDARATQLPEHLEDVDLELRAFVGSVDIPLNELLKLEVGDVIPLATPATGLLDLYAEERACARVRWGKHGSNLAVRIEAIDVHPNEINQPSDNAQS
jgi:flagellar motor switch protein FliM